MSENGGLLTLEPEELIFQDVHLNQAYTQVVTITNNLRATVEATVRSGSTDRFTVSPSKIFLKSGHSCQLQVTLKVLKFVQKRKAAEQGQRDVFHIKATYFDQKFHATFFLAPEEAGMERIPRPIGAALRDPTPPRTDPRGHSRMPSAAPAHTAERQQSAENASAAEDMSQMRGSISEPPQRRSSRFSAWQMADRGAEQLLSEPHQDAAAHNAVLHRSREPTEPQGGAAMQAKSSFHQPASGIASPQVQGQGGSWSHEEEELLDREVQDELLATIEEQEQALREKDEMLEYLQSCLRAAEMEAAQATGAASPMQGLMPERENAGEAHPQHRELQAANAQLEGANAQLRGRVQDLAAELQEAREELVALGGLQEQLAADVEGDVDVDALVLAAVGRERAAQDARNSKVLELLKSKDQVIERFEVRFAEAQAETRQLAADLAEARRRAEAAEARAAELLEQRAKARRAQERQLTEAANLQASLRANTAALKAELESYKREAARKSPEPRRREVGASGSKAKGSSDAREAALKAELNVTSQSLAASKQEAEALSVGLQKANAFIEDLQGQLAAQQEAAAAKEKEASQLQEQITELEAILSEPGKDPVQTPSSRVKDLEEKVAALEASNGELEQALVALRSEHERHARPQQREHEGGMPGCKALQLAHFDTSSAGTIAELRASSAEKSALLAAAEERLARLEALHSIAQETAMCGEQQLEEMRAALVGLGEVAQLGKADALSARALAARLSARVSEMVMSEQRATAAAEVAAKRLAEAQDAHHTEVAALREVARAKEKAFRDALQLQSSVNGAAVPGAEEASAAAAIQDAKLADAACQVKSTGIDAQQSSKCGGSPTAGTPPTSVASGAEEQSQALQEAAAAKAEAANLKAELLAKEKELQSAFAAAEQALAEANGRATSATKDAEEWAREAEDRRMQLSVLMETMETLQTGSLGDKEQRIVALTAKFAAARLKEAAAVRRVDDLTKEAAAREEAAAQLHVRLEAAERQLVQLHADLDAADRHTAQLTADLDAASICRDAAVQDAAAAQAQLLLQEEVARAAAAEAEQRVVQSQEALSAAEAELLRTREEADRTLQHDRETLQAESYARCAALAEELQATRASHREAVQNAQAELAASQQAAAAALASRPLPEDLEKALERAQEKEAAAQAAGAKATCAQQQAEQLAAEVDVLSAEVAELRADAETRGAAVEGLHATLERIERATAEQIGPVRRAGQVRWSADGAWDSRAGTDGRRASAEDVSLASLSKELVHARMSEANMQRKLRVAARAEEMLRERLSQRDQRITDLKSAVAAAEAEAADARRGLACTFVADKPQAATQTEAHLLTARSFESETATAGEPTISAPTAEALAATASGEPDVSSPGQVAEQCTHDAGNPSSAVDSGRLPAGISGSLAETPLLALPAPEASIHREADPAGGPAAQGPDSPRERSSQSTALVLRESNDGGSPQRGAAEALADARLEMARRNAEIAHLQGSLTQLVAAQQAQLHRPSPAVAACEQDITELSRQLRELQRECAAASVAAASVLNVQSRLTEDSPPAEGQLSISELVDQLVDLIQEKKAAVKRLESAAKAAAEERARAAAQPLECSQRAVVRDLSVKVAAMSKELAQIKSERDVALERLRTLRASLGSSRIPGDTVSAEAAATPLALPASTGAESQHSTAPAVAPAIAVEAESLSGLCTMLAHHLDVLEASQQPLSGVLQSCDEAYAEEDSAGALGLAVQQAVGKVTLEAGAMRSTLHVLSACLPQLHAKPASAGSQAEPPAKESAAVLDSRAAGQDPKSREESTSAAAAAAAAAVAELKAKAQKWKMRCQELKREMAVAAAAAAAREAAVSERLAAAESAALQQAAAAAPSRGDRPAEAGRSISVQARGAQAEARAAAARAAEAEARLEAAQKQLHTVRGGASAAQRALQEEIQSLKACLAQEKAGRARIVESLRSTIDGLRAAGDVEGRLKAELVSAQEQLASVRASLEAAEERSGGRRKEVQSLREELDRAQTELRRRGADAELQEHDATLRLSDAQQRLALLESKLVAADTQQSEVKAAMTAALDSVDGLQPSDRLVEDVRSLHKALKAANDRCRLLERQATSLAESGEEDRGALRWEGFVRARRYREAVQQLREDLRAAIAEREAAVEEAGREHTRADAMRAEAKAQSRRLEEARRAAEEERQRSAQQHRGALADMAARMEAERAALRQEAAAAAASAAAAAEDRSRAAAAAQLQDAQAREQASVLAARADCARAARELECLRQQFRAYQAVKAGEVAGLEARLRVALSQPPAAGRPWKAAAAADAGRPTHGGSRPQASSSSTRRATAPANDTRPSEGLQQACGAAAEVADAVQREAVAAAEREADLERLQRQAAEAAAAEARETAEKLREKLQACQRELRSVQDRLAAATAERRQQPAANFLRLQGELANAQEALKAARSESTRRLRELQSLQGAASGAPLGNAAALATETAAREAAEAKLREVKAALLRKKQLVTDLRKRVDELSEQLVKAQAQNSAQNLQGIETKARSAQAACARKDEMLRELRDRMEHLMHGAAARAAEADVADDGSELTRLRNELGRLRTELARKDAELARLQSAQADLEQAQQEAATAGIGADPAGEDQAAKRQAALTACGLGLLRSLERALDLSQLCSKAMSDAAERLSSNGGQGVHWQSANADTIAALVDLSASEVRELLGEERGCTMAELGQEVAAVLSCCEAILLPESNGGAETQAAGGNGRMRNQAVQKSLCALLDAAEAEIHRAGSMLEDAVIQQQEVTASEQGTAAAAPGRKPRRQASHALAKLSESLIEGSLQDLDE